MPRFQFGGVWYDAPNYIAAQAMHRAAQGPAPIVVAPVVAPVAVVFTTVVTPVDNFAGRSPTRFGVGEEIDLSFTTLPLHPAAFFGGLQWAVKSGPGTLNNPVPNDGTARLVMGERAGTVVLELRTIAGPGVAAVVKATKTLWVAEPSGSVMVHEPGTGIYHRQNTASAGFYGLVQMRPTDVSFYRCQWREGAAPIRATGSMNVTIARTAQTSESGGQGQATQQELANLAGARHPVMGTWLDLGPGNFATGSVMQGHDDVTSITMNPPYAVGTFDWDIHWIFRVRGAMNEKHYFTATHSEAVTATGQMTISKATCTIVCQAGDVDSDK